MARSRTTLLEASGGHFECEHPRKVATPSAPVTPSSATRCPAYIPQRLFHRFRRWLEQLHQIAGRILQQDLAAARSGDDVVEKLNFSLSEGLNVALKIAALHNYPVPSTRFRPTAVGHRLRTPTWTFRCKRGLRALLTGPGHGRMPRSDVEYVA
jgi:hypothetical protein